MRCVLPYATLAAITKLIFARHFNFRRCCTRQSSEPLASQTKLRDKLQEKSPSITAPFLRNHSSSSVSNKSLYLFFYHTCCRRLDFFASLFIKNKHYRGVIFLFSFFFLSSFFSPGNSITTIASEYDLKTRDRRWKMVCGYNKAAKICAWTGYRNGFDQPLAFDCPHDGFIAGKISTCFP